MPARAVSRGRRIGLAHPRSRRLSPLRPHDCAGHRGGGARQALRGRGGGRRARPDGPGRHVPGAPRTQRRGQDHHRGDPRGAPASHLGRGGGPRPLLGAGGRRPSASASAWRFRRRASTRSSPSTRRSPSSAASTARGCRSTEVIARGGAGGEARAPAWGRSPAARSSGWRVAVRPGGRPRAALPRRADHRPRPAVAAAALGRSSTALKGAGPHGGPHHPLHGRGRDALRPTSSSSTTARWSPWARRAELMHSLGGEHVVEFVAEPPSPPRRWRAVARAARGAVGAGRRRSPSPCQELHDAVPAVLRSPRRTGADSRGSRTRDGDAGRRLRRPHRPAPAEARMTDRARLRACGGQLFLCGLRAFTREPSATFWVFGFPAPDVGRAGRSPSGTGRPRRLTVAVAEGPAPAELRGRPRAARGWLPRCGPLDEAPGAAAAPGKGGAGGGAGERRRTSSARPAAARGDGRAAAAVDDALQRAAGRQDPLPLEEQTCVSEPGARYIDFLIPGLLGFGHHVLQHLGARLGAGRRCGWGSCSSASPPRPMRQDGLPLSPSPRRGCSLPFWRRCSSSASPG